MRTVLFLAALTPLLPVRAVSQQSSPAATRGLVVPDRAVAAARVGGVPVTVDGRLDEPAWAGAQEAGNFVQFQPNPGAPASQRTVARVLYDDDAVYVGARLYDSAPDSVVARLARRDDAVFSDWFFVLLDSYHDRRTGFAFGVNPRGVKVDLQYSEDTREDPGWDAVWDAAITRDADGWTAEFRIPLSQLRFSAGSATWGVNFRRRLARLDEISDWSPVPRSGAAFVSAAGELTGLTNLRPRRRLEIQPYALSGVQTAPGDAANPFYRPADPTTAMGADVKYGLTSDLTLALTLNPDFGQVEADPSVVNLSGFETFLPERRPFFLEGAEILRPTFPQFPTVFHSRRIGRAPHGWVPDSALYADVPTATRILGAAKLTGKTAGGWSVGGLDAVTGAARAPFVDALGNRGATTVEPLTNYGVWRIARDLRRGQTILGAVGTLTNRGLPASGELDFLPSAAYVLGVDGLHRFAGGRLEIAGSLLGSRVQGDTSAINRIQRSPVHRLDRPDASHLSYDPTRTSLTGYSANLMIQNRTGRWRFYADTRARSGGFEVNDLGYLGRADQVTSTAHVWYHQYRPGAVFRSWQAHTSSWANWSFGGERQWTGVSFWMNGQLKNYWTIAGGTDYNLARLDPDALRGGPALRGNASWWPWLSVDSDPRRAVTATLWLWHQFELGTGAGDAGAEGLIGIRPSDRLSISLGPRFNGVVTADQFVTNATPGGGTRYVRARLVQRTASLTFRAGLTITPALSLQAYAQPFVSAGAYTGFGRITDPKAATFSGRLSPYGADQLSYDAGATRYAVDADADGTPEFNFANPDFTFRELRANVVLRWEYRSGSTLFLVWSQGRQSTDGSGRLRLGSDVGNLLSAPGTNNLMLKVSYWMGR